VSYELGSNTMLDGLDEALDGLSAGEETTFEHHLIAQILLHGLLGLSLLLLGGLGRIRGHVLELLLDHFEETVEKELRDQMVLDVLAETMDVKVSQGEVFNFLASIAQQYGMDPNAFIQAIIRR